MAFYSLRLITGCAELADDFQNRFREPLLINRASIIELKGKKNLEPPPFAAHKSSFP